MKTNSFFKFLAALLVLVLPFTNGFAQDTPQLTDAEIASVAVTANQIDIDYAKIAQAQSEDLNVRQFAKTMIADHSAIIKQATDLATKLGVVPKDNAVTQSLLDQSKETTKNLKAAKGKAFDKAYVDNEVAYHKAVIDAVKGLLIPQAQNEELKNLLQTAVPILETHLHHAEMVQSLIEK